MSGTTWAPVTMGEPTHDELIEDEGSYYAHLFHSYGPTMTTRDAERIAGLHCTTVGALVIDYEPMPLLTTDRRRVRTIGLVMALGY